MSRLGISCPLTCSRPIGWRSRMIKACASCRMYRSDPSDLERFLPGLTSLSSAFGASRADTGLCMRDEVFRRPQGICSFFEARSGIETSEAAP